MGIVNHILFSNIRASPLDQTDLDALFCTFKEIAFNFDGYLYYILNWTNFSRQRLKTQKFIRNRILLTLI